VIQRDVRTSLKKKRSGRRKKNRGRRIRRFASLACEEFGDFNLLYKIELLYFIYATAQSLPSLSLFRSLHLCLAFSHFSNEKIVSMKFPTIFPLRTAVENEFPSKRLPAMAGRQEKKNFQCLAVSYRKPPFFPLPTAFAAALPHQSTTPSTPLLRQKMHSHSCVKTFPLFPREMQAAGKEEL